MKSIEWCGNSVRLIDQTKLPSEESYVVTDDYRVLADAIRTLKIRGAPAIGIAAAYGVALASLKSAGTDFQSFRSQIKNTISELASTRPTAVNLFWALQRMERALDRSQTIEDARYTLIKEAVAIHQEDAEQCRRIGENGLDLVPQRASILTYCNTGALATGGEGTALSIITTAHRNKKCVKVYVCETRPALQGARLTTLELMNHGIEVILLTDNMAAFEMYQEKIDLVIVGADRIAANGDVANKIGTYNLAVLADYHNVPFYVAAPSSTIDASIASGAEIPIEQRDGQEIVEMLGRRIAPPGVQTSSPAFDVTPSDLITAIITDKGVYRPPFRFRPVDSALQPSAK